MDELVPVATHVADGGAQAADEPVHRAVLQRLLQIGMHPLFQLRVLRQRAAAHGDQPLHPRVGQGLFLHG